MIVIINNNNTSNNSDYKVVRHHARGYLSEPSKGWSKERQCRFELAFVNIGAFIIRKGFRGPLYYNYNKVC